MAFTFNGFGSRFYGRGDPDIDDSFTSTEWFVAAFIPIFPIRSFRMMDEEKSGRGFAVAGFGYSSRSYIVLEERSICWPQVGRVYAFMAGTLFWWYVWLGVLLPRLHLADAVSALGLLAGIFLALAGGVAPFIFVWRLRRRAYNKAMLAAGKEEPARVPEPAALLAEDAPPIAMMRQLGVRFATPPGWSCESLPEHDGVLLLAEEAEGGYQANLFLEVKSHGKTALLAAAQQLSHNLRQAKVDYHEVAVREGRTLSTPWVSVECTHRHQELPLTDTHFIVQLHTGNWLFISASTLSSLDSKYRPVIQAFVDSIGA